MTTTIKNAWLVDIDPPRARRGALRVADGIIVDVGKDVRNEPGDEVLDCRGAVVLPGLVNGHVHLCSALALGMPPAEGRPENFRQLLEQTAWRFDAALDLPAVEAGVQLGAVEALRCGTTTVFDHHSSPNCAAGALDAVEGALERLGLRGVLCFEISDRNGPDTRQAGVAETERYLDKCQRRHDGRFAGLVGAHALFTLEDETLNELRDLARSFEIGVHLHLAEDAYDEEVCSAEHQLYPLDRLRAHGLLQPGMVFAHGTHLSDEDVAALADVRAAVVHNPRSNMKSGVGYGFPHRLIGRAPLLLGSDAMLSDLLAEVQAAWLKARDERVDLRPEHAAAMLAGSARRAAELLQVPLGRLESQHAADLVVTDYVPATPLADENAAAHLVLGVGARHVTDVMIAGKWRLRERRVQGLDETAVRKAAAQAAADLRQRM